MQDEIKLHEAAAQALATLVEKPGSLSEGRERSVSDALNTSPGLVFPKNEISKAANGSTPNAVKPPRLEGEGFFLPLHGVRKGTESLFDN